MKDLKKLKEKNPKLVEFVSNQPDWLLELWGWDSKSKFKENDKTI